MPLSLEEMMEFREQLRRRRDELREVVDGEVIHEERESYEDLLGRVRDTGDGAFVDVVADLNIANLDRVLEEFSAIQEALQRINRGSLGDCVDCGAEIQPARLKAYPTAQRCMRCQRHREATYASKPHSKV